MKFNYGEETYISRKSILEIVRIFDIMTNEANEACFDSFCLWRILYDRRHKVKIGVFDIKSQVNMFDHDLNSLYYDKTETIKADNDI